MNTLNSVIRSRYAVDRIRRVPVIGVDSPLVSRAGARPGGLPAAARSAPSAADVSGDAVVVPLRGGAGFEASGLPSTPAGEPSTVAIGALDAGNRLAAAKPVDRLGWAPGEAVVAACEPGRVVIRAGVPTDPTQSLVTLDARRQLRLPACAVASLGVRGAGQVLAAATADGELVLANAAVIAEVATGVIAAPAPVPARRPRRSGTRQSGSGTGRRRSRRRGTRSTRPVRRTRRPRG